MPTYTVQVTVEVWGDSVQDAYTTIRQTLDHAKRREIVHVDSEVLETKPDEPSEGDEWSGGFAKNH